MREDTTALREGAAQTAAPERTAKRKKKAALLWTLWGLLVVVILSGLGVGALCLRYQERFYPRTWIDGVEVSHLSLAAAAERLEQASEQVTLRLTDDGETLTTLPLSALVEAEVLPAMAEDAFAQQHALGGLFGWLRGDTWRHTGEALGYPDRAELLNVLEAALYAEGRVEPEDAYLALREDGYELVAEVRGNLADEELCADTLSPLVAGESDLTAREITVEVPGGRILPEVTAEDTALLEEKEEIDGYLSAAVTLDFENGSTYTLSPAEISAVSDITLTDSGAVCTPDLGLVRSLTDELADTYGLDGVYAKFHNVEPTRELIYYRVGDNGWRLDRDKLAADVAEAIASGVDATVYPSYDRTWYWQNYYGIDNTFVEVSIDNQYLWYYVDGEVLVETPVVTGNLSTGDFTRRGCFKIYGMVTDTTLTGPTWNDHVEYWMPFDGGIGFHDSSWRDEYGGDIYITDGSHGCVNTPLEAVATIYENIWKGVPVVVY